MQRITDDANYFSNFNTRSNNLSGRTVLNFFLPPCNALSFLCVLLSNRADRHQLLHTTGMDEQKMLRLCRKDDRTAQEALYRLYAPEMLGVCYRYTKSIDDAEDILQEAFIKVFGNIGQFRAEGPLGAWIRRIVVTTAISYLRRHNRYRNQMDFEHQPLHVAVEGDLSGNLNTRDLMDIIRRLPAGYQTVFNLVGIEGYDHAEVAQLLGISVQTSRSQYSRARAQLMKWILEEEAKTNRTAVQKN